MSYFAENLKNYRENAGLSQMELSKKMGTSHQNINRGERGEVIPSIEVCIKLADFFNITLDELVGRKN